MKRLYWLSKNLPELSNVAPELQHGVWSIAVQRAHRHWQVWASYVAFFGAIYLLPRFDVHLGRLVFNVVFALYLWIGVVACQVVRIYFARRYIE
jgi:hypothetical protein